MTDTFPSGFRSPVGAPGDAGEPTGDVTSTLAELERKLRELERELTSIGRRRVRPEEDVAVAQAAESPLASPPASSPAHPLVGFEQRTSRLVDERVEPQRPPLPVGPPPPREHTPLPPSPPPPREQVAPPPTLSTEADELPRPTEAQLAILAELRRFRERLERFANELIADYDAVLARAMSGVPMGKRMEPQAPPPPPAVSEEPLFEGRIELGVGPFYDIGSLSAFEQQVASVPNVSEVSVRRFEASHAVVDVRLAAPVALLSELRRVLDSDFGVRQVGSGRVALTFDES
jgi:hypothetical protein